MATVPSTSVVGNAANTRERLSAVRQRMGLESARGTSPQSSLRPIAPSPAAPANKPGAAIQTASSSMIVEGSGGNPNRDMVTVKQQPAAAPSASRLGGIARDFIAQYRPPARLRQADRMPAQAAPQATAPGRPAPRPTGAPVSASSAPMFAEGYRGNPRADMRARRAPGAAQPRRPNADPRMLQRQAMDFLYDKLGRVPTQTELQLFLARGPRG